MEKLLIKSKLKIDALDFQFRRYLFKEIIRNARLIGIKGARGTGKTTLLLQLAKESDNVLYVALDDLFFTENSLYELAERFVKQGGKYLYLDEVHKYPNWSREIKLIYDDFNDLNVVFTSSSILDIYKGESDLSRRATSYTLKELSFREYLELYENIVLPAFSLSEIVSNHESISLELIKEIKPFKYFHNYLQYGSYPYFEDGNTVEYYQKLINTINLILDIDLQAIENIAYYNIAKLKRLLYVIASNVPYIPNISKLSEKIQISRNALVHALQLLEKAELIFTLYKESRSISLLNKPDKIWLHNTNLNYAISNSIVDAGNIRETIFLQNISAKHKVSIHRDADFIIDDMFVFEIGGKNKKQKQIEKLNNAWLVKDDIEIGIGNSIPLWLFGFLY